MPTLSHSATVPVAAAPAAVHALFSDVTRLGETSPTCKSCVWEDPATAGTVGAVFVGHNEVGGHGWETRNQVVVADETSFGWSTGPGLATWTYHVEPGETPGTSLLTESWEFTDEGQDGMRAIFGERAEQIIAGAPATTEAGIAATLAAMKALLESNPS